MKQLHLLLAVWLVAANTGIAFSQPALSSDNTNHEAAIGKILDDESAAWLKGDAEAFAAHVRHDVAFANAVGMFSVGKQPFVAQHRRIFTTIYQGSAMRQFVQTIMYVGSSVAIVETITKLSGFKQLPAGTSAVDGALYTRLEQVMVEKNGIWAVASFHNVPIQPGFVDDGVRALTASRGH